MADRLFLPYLLVLLLVPVLVRWRWGLLAAVTTAVAEGALTVLIFYVLAINHMLPDVGVAEPPPEHLFEKMRRGQAVGYVQLILFGALPAAAALVGGGLAVAWSVVLALWRSIANRKRP